MFGEWGMKITVMDSIMVIWILLSLYDIFSNGIHNYSFLWLFGFGLLWFLDEILKIDANRNEGGE